MCKLAKINKHDFSSQFNSQKFEIMHIREIWSPDLLDFFCMVFYTNSMGFQQNLNWISQEADLARYLLLDERCKDF